MKRTIALLLFSLTAAPTLAGDIDSVDNLLQGEFRQLSKDLGAALSYKAIVPAETLGITGFDIGFEATATKLEHSDAWDKATSGNSSSTLVVPKLHLHKGLPLGLDVGAFYSAVPDTNITLWGAELRYALIEGGLATPALGLRGTYSKLSGVDQLDLDTRGLELTISKGFANFTPYAGIGRVWTTSTPDVAGLSEEEITQDKYYVGANFNLGLVNVVFEGDKTGQATTYGAKFGWRF